MGICAVCRPNISGARSIRNLLRFAHVLIVDIVTKKRRVTGPVGSIICVSGLGWIIAMVGGRATQHARFHGPIAYIRPVDAGGSAIVLTGLAQFGPKQF